MLEKDGTLNIHQRNLQKLAIEMYKVKNGLSPDIMANLFTRKDRGNGDFVIPKVKRGIGEQGNRNNKVQGPFDLGYCSRGH